MNIRLVAIEPDPIEIDPRHCGWCGCTIDRHEMVDAGEGPIFYCIDIDPVEMTTLELERRAVLIEREEVAAMVRQMELDDPRDRWRHTGEPPPPIEVRNGPIETALQRAPEPYRPAQSTIFAFWYVVGLDDPDRLKAWFADHPRDVPALLKLLETKQC